MSCEHERAEHFALVGNMTLSWCVDCGALDTGDGDGWTAPRTDSPPLDAGQSAIVAEAVANPPKAGPALRALLADEVATDIGDRDEISQISQEPRDSRPDKTVVGNGIGHSGEAGQPGVSEVGAEGSEMQTSAPAVLDPGIETATQHIHSGLKRTPENVAWVFMASAAISALEDAGPLSGDDYFIDGEAWERYAEARKAWLATRRSSQTGSEVKP